MIRSVKYIIASKAAYADKLRDPRWQKMRLEILGRDEFKCVDCHNGEVTLHVHHLYYCLGREPWEYPLWSLKTLCEDCHSAGQTYRDDDGTFRFSSWEHIVEILSCGNPGILDSFLWDAANQIARAKRLGATDHEASWMLLEAATQFRKEREPTTEAVS